MEVKHIKFDKLLDKQVAHDDLISVVKRNNYSNGAYYKRAERLQKKIIKMFLKILLREIIDHKVFYFPKKILSLQIGVTSRPKTYKFKYDAQNTIAVCMLRTSFRFFRKMSKVKPYIRLQKDYYYKINREHAKGNQYYNK